MMNDAATRDAKLAEMRALVIDAHAGQSRNAGRVPYAAHVLSVAEILRTAIEQGGECDDESLGADLYLAALGHDLYEDTKTMPADVRQRFGARVDTFIEGMTNRSGDDDRADYEARMTTAREEIRLIKLADLVDNVVSCAYGIHDLGRRWVSGTFRPLAAGMVASVGRATYERFPKTAHLLESWLDFGLERLDANLAIALALAPESEGADAAAKRIATWDGTLPGDPARAKELLQKDRERERREGWLSKGMRVFVEPDGKDRK